MVCYLNKQKTPGMRDDGKFQFRSDPTPPEIHPAESVRDESLRATLDYWLQLKGGRAMPARSEIVARDIKQGLRCIHIYQDQTGKLVSEHPDPGVRLRFGMILRQVARTGQPLRSLSVRHTGSLLHDSRAEGLWLPLGDGARVEQILAQSSLTTIPPGAPNPTDET
jgi:hypothetical protein